MPAGSVPGRKSFLTEKLPLPKIAAFPCNINALSLRSFAYGVPESHPFSDHDPVKEPESDYFEMKYMMSKNKKTMKMLIAKEAMLAIAPLLKKLLPLDKPTFVNIIWMTVDNM